MNAKNPLKELFVDRVPRRHIRSCKPGQMIRGLTELVSQLIGSEVSLFGLFSMQSVLMQGDRDSDQNNDKRQLNGKQNGSDSHLVLYC